MESSRTDIKSEKEESGVFVDLATNKSIADPRPQFIKKNAPIVAMFERGDAYNRGTQLTNEEILEMLAVTQSDEPPTDKIEFRAQIGTIGFTQKWGKKSTQEDRALAGDAPEQFESLMETQRLIVLDKTASQLQSIITTAKLGENSGTTLCAATVIGNTVYTTNLGDSLAYKFEINSKGEVKEELLNAIHQPDTESEQKRLKKLQEEGQKISITTKTIGDFTISRLNAFGAGAIAFTRSIGDNFFSDKGLSHDPEIKKHTIAVPDDGGVILVIASDALSEGNKLKMEAIREIIAKNRNKPESELSLLLAEAAEKAGVLDNTTVIVMKLNPKDVKAKQLIVLDGHHGDKVSDAVYQLYNLVLANQILLIKLRNVELLEKAEKIIDERVTNRTIEQYQHLYEGWNQCLKEIKDPNRMLDVMKEFTTLVDISNYALNSIEQFHEAYAPQLDAKYLESLRIAIKEQNDAMIKASKNSLADGDAEKIKQTRRQMQQMTSDLENLFKIADVVSQIEYGSNTKMRNKIENKLFAAFENFPSKPSLQIIRDLRNELESQRTVENLKQKVSGIFTSADMNLVNNLDSAIKDITKIEESILQQEQKVSAALKSSRQQYP